MPDDEALRARLHAVFLEELDEHVERLERGLGLVTAGLPDVPAGVVDELFRSAHSLKGAAGSVGAAPIAALCHELEDTLSRVREGDATLDEPLVHDLLRLVDEVANAGASLRDDAPSGAVGAVGGEGPPPLQSPPRPAPAAAARPQVAAPAREASTVRLTGARLDSMLSGAGELISATYRAEMLVAGVRAALEEVDPQARADGGLDRLVRLAGAQQSALRGLATGFAESVRQVRMVPFTEATARLARIVRDLSAEQGKQARLVVEAAEVEVDKELVSTLHDVIGHAVRNAVAHGIEPPDERSAVGKPATGTVTVHAALRSQGIVVTVTDDGRGVDARRVHERAVRLGLVASGGELDLAEVLFHPGLSTADTVTELSGRGVGLDAVRSAVDAIGGSVSFDSVPGEGSALRVNVPLTLSTLRVLVLRVSGQLVALPTNAVERLVRVPADRARLGGREVLEHGETVVPLVPLARVLGWGTGSVPEVEPTGLLVAGTHGSAVLVADELVAEREVVLRTASPRLAGLRLLLGTAQLEDGRVCLVLSPSVCARLALSSTSEPVVRPPDGVDSPPRVLLVEDTVTTRELERSILLDAGYDVAVAPDGQQAWELLQSRSFDAVVSDVDMPRMDGIALCRAIRASRQHAELPVVLVTSLHRDADRRRGLEAGADAYLAKQGFDRVELVATLERLL